MNVSLLTKFDWSRRTPWRTPKGLGLQECWGASTFLPLPAALSNPVPRIQVDGAVRSRERLYRWHRSQARHQPGLTLRRRGCTEPGSLCPAPLTAYCANSGLPRVWVPGPQRAYSGSVRVEGEKKRSDLQTGGVILISKFAIAVNRSRQGQLHPS